MISTDCTWVRDHWAAYEDQELSADERYRIETHLAACKDCFVDTADTERAWSLFKQMHPRQTPPTRLKFPADQIAALPPRPSTAAVSARRGWMGIAVAGAAYAVLALFLRAHKPSDISPFTTPPQIERLELFEPQTIEWTLSSERGPETLRLAWAREIGGTPNE